MTRRTRSSHARTNADLADKYDLYQRAVQSVQGEIGFVDRVYTRLRGTRASLLREDFCGTANTSCEWVRRRATNVGVGMDIDPVPMAWGRAHNVAKLSAAQRARLDLRRADVLHAGTHRDARGMRRGYDVILAMNFSYWCFKRRRLLLKYFTAVHHSLDRRGLFFLDFYGGADALREAEETRRVPARPGGYGSPPFTYVWDQKSYDPITGDILCYIHFRFADGSQIRRAFRYDWRLWTIPEVRDVLADAGFARSRVYWEGDDGKGGGNGIFRPTGRGEACPAYIAYIVAEKA